jgi:hypothetical protein
MLGFVRVTGKTKVLYSWVVGNVEDFKERIVGQMLRSVLERGDRSDHFHRLRVQPDLYARRRAALYDSGR